VLDFDELLGTANIRELQLAMSDANCEEVK
jgi:hypothetical protein